MLLLLLHAALSAALASQSVEDLRRQHDEAVRAQNAEVDWWLVSTSDYGLKQHRFYIDRNQMRSFEPYSRAWIDHYSVGERGALSSLSHDKVLTEARCEGDPQIRFRSGVHYEPNGAAAPMTEDGTWSDVVPGSSMQTLWRFICHSEPANAIVYVPDAPAADAMRYYRAAQPRRTKSLQQKGARK